MNEMPFLSTSKKSNISVLYCLLHILMSILHVLLWLVLKTTLAVKTTGTPSTDGDTEAQKRSFSTLTLPAGKSYSSSMLLTLLG